MSNKRKLTTILAVAGATVLAAGGSAFVTQIGLSLTDRSSNTEQGSEVAVNEKETEQPLTVEKFAATKDSFTVKPQSDTTKKDTKKSDSTTESKQTDENTNGEDSTVSDASSQDGSTSGSTSVSGDGASTDFSSSDYYSSDGKFYNESEGGYYDERGLYHDRWGGYYSADGAYYDGQGGYWDGDGYHSAGSGSSSSGSTSGGSSSGNGTSGSNSSGGGSSDGISIDDGSNSGGSSDNSGSSGSNSSAYDDSYMMYDIDSRYISEDEISDWSSEDLARLRNEIFARHGRIFTTQKWIDYFATKTWYVPRYDNVDALLNDYEWANLEVIMNLEDQRY